MQSEYKVAPVMELSNEGTKSGDGKEEVTQHNQLGLLNGVVVPCSLNILGVVLFLWLPWAIGMAGGGQLLGMFVLGEAQTVLTVLSLSAIVSNGTMKGGGSYFMISRSLGPELGGAMGFLFYISYAVSATFYAAGFGKEVQQTFFADMEHAWGGFFLTFCSSCALLLVLIVALIGANLFTKINVILFMMQFGAIFVALFTIFFGSPKNSENGWQSSLLRENWSPGYKRNDACQGECSFQKVFAIIFPAVTGVMEGANLSGDLKNPGKDIGRGTLMAVVGAFLIYIVLIIAFAGAFQREELITNEAIFQEACVNEYVVVVGILVSTSSSALGAIFGGSRVLQALARDEIFPRTKWLGRGTVKGDEPWVAVLVTWGISQACMFIGGLDVIAPIISTFFCLSYACCNLACLLVSISGTPNFRPRFKYFSWHTCLFGLILNIFVMFFLNVYYATASLVIMLGIFVYLLYTAPQTTWGDVRQALIYHQVRKYLLRLDTRLQHGKTWRPSVLLLIDQLNGPLVEFCSHLKKGGLYVIGNVVLGARFDRLTNTASRMKKALGDYIYTENLKAFPAVAVGSTARTAYQNLMVMSGLGAMTPNTVVVPYIEGLHLKQQHHPDGGSAPTPTTAASSARSSHHTDTKAESPDRYSNSKARILLSPLSSHKGRKKKNGGPTTSLLSSPSLSSLSSAQLLPIMSPSSSLLPIAIHGAKSNITYDSPSPHHRSRDDPRSKSQFFHDLSLKMERKDYSASAFFNSSVTSMHEFVNLLGDGRALSKNVLVTRNFDKLVPERISASRFIDIWLLDENCVKSWNAFEKQALLIVEMAHILLKNKVWGSQCQTRIVMPVKSNTDELELTVSPPSGKSSAVFHSSTPLHESGSVDAKLLKTEVILEEVEPSEGDKMLQHGGDNDDGDDDDEKEPVEAAKSMLEQRLYQARINIDRIMVIPISQEDLLSDSGYSTSSMPPPSKLNRMIRERSASTLLSLLPLPPLPKNLSSASKECDKYYRVLGEISQGLPPVALLSESDDLIMSREI